MRKSFFGLVFLSLVSLTGFFTSLGNLVANAQPIPVPPPASTTVEEVIPKLPVCVGGPEVCPYVAVRDDGQGGVIFRLMKEGQETPAGHTKMPVEEFKTQHPEMLEMLGRAQAGEG